MDAASPEHTFAAPLWIWQERRDTWTFVTLPEEASEAVHEASLARGPRAGFGSVRVEVRIGASTWRTSVFPGRDGLFVLPVKRSVREAEGVEAGDDVRVALRVV